MQVRTVLHDARMPEYIPVFARYGVSFQRLLDMAEDDAQRMGIGPTIYSCIQRSLAAYLARTKVGEEGDVSPSAPGKHGVLL